MKSIRNYFFKWYFAIPLCVLVLTVSCNGPEEAVVPSLASHDGVELFEGLLMAKGETAERLPELKQQMMARTMISDQMLTNLTALENSVIEVIEARYPGYFSEFKQAITSGKHFEIQRALTEGQELLVQTSCELSGRQAPDMASIRSLAEQFDISEVIAEDGTIDLEKLRVTSEDYPKIWDGRSSDQTLVIAFIVVVLVWLVPISASELSFHDLSLSSEQLIQAIVEATT